jgi:hypothetical protein
MYNLSYNSMQEPLPKDQTYNLCIIKHGKSLINQRFPRFFPSADGGIRTLVPDTH